VAIFDEKMVFGVILHVKMAIFGIIFGTFPIKKTAFYSKKPHFPSKTYFSYQKTRFSYQKTRFYSKKPVFPIKKPLFPIKNAPVELGLVKQLRMLALDRLQLDRDLFS
jgi:hypothetical protein